MSEEEFNYSMDDLIKLEEEMLNKEKQKVDTKEVFSYLEEHSRFSHTDENGPDNSISYYFHNQNDGVNLLFIQIPKEKGKVYTDEGSCLGREKWFDELFEFTKKMHEHHFKI